MKLIETNSLHKLKDILYDRKQNIYTFAIESPENPIGNKSTDSENKKAREEFESYLNKFKLYYFKLKGQYGHSEHSYFIANVNLDICKYLFGSKKFDQDSFICGVLDAENKIKTIFYLYKQNNKKQFELIEAVNNYSEENTAEDFFTKFKNFKFKIPFRTFESLLCAISDKLYKDLNWNPEYYKYLEYTSKVENKTLKYLWEYNSQHILTKVQERERVYRVKEAQKSLDLWTEKYKNNEKIKNMINTFMGENK